MNILFIFLQLYSFTFQAGDILFQNCNCGSICDAIEDVTMLTDHRRYSHMAMIVAVGDSLVVAEANVDGVRLVSIDSFIYRYVDSTGLPTIDVGRLKKPYRHLIPDASNFVMKQIGLSYDYEFIAGNNQFYCSELIYEAFKEANHKPFFVEKKMTFKSYGATQFHPTFVAYYRKIKKKIPEGKMGTNPADISRDDRLELLKFK